jgi:O-6-methylguanine DNA methyltransferase
MNFYNKVWHLTKKIPKGKVSTYGLIAKKLRTKAYRAVGQALRHNPYAPRVPCHRVVKSDGSIGGFAGKMNNKKKVIMLRKEGIKIKNFKIENFKKVLYKF